MTSCMLHSAQNPSQHRSLSAVSLMLPQNFPGCRWKNGDQQTHGSNHRISSEFWRKSSGPKGPKSLKFGPWHKILKNSCSQMFWRGIIGIYWHWTNHLSQFHDILEWRHPLESPLMSVWLRSNHVEFSGCFSARGDDSHLHIFRKTQWSNWYLKYKVNHLMIRVLGRWWLKLVVTVPGTSQLPRRTALRGLEAMGGHWREWRGWNGGAGIINSSYGSFPYSQSEAPVSQFSRIFHHFDHDFGRFHLSSQIHPSQTCTSREHRMLRNVTMPLCQKNGRVVVFSRFRIRLCRGSHWFSRVLPIVPS